MTAIRKNLIFTITHGRTGTTMLTEVFRLFDNIRSEHEPQPNYADVLPYVKANPRYAIQFLEKKIGVINMIQEDNYIETSNVFGKGFFIPLIRMGVFPKLVFLNREFREVAQSLYKRGSFPARTKIGRHYSADPSFAGTLPIFQPSHLSDYQVCFWGVLDSFWRQQSAAAIYDKEGKKYIWASATDFNDFERTLEIGEYLGLFVRDKEEAEFYHRRETNKHHNANSQTAGVSRGHIDFDGEEKEVIDRVAFYDPIFVDSVLESRYVSKTLVNAVSSQN